MIGVRAYFKRGYLYGTTSNHIVLVYYTHTHTHTHTMFKQKICWLCALEVNFNVTSFDKNSRTLLIKLFTENVQFN